MATPRRASGVPLSGTQASQINLEFDYRGSAIKLSNRITLPESTKEFQTLDAVTTG
jgi:hypothetical protein